MTTGTISATAGSIESTTWPYGVWKAAAKAGPIRSRRQVTSSANARLGTDHGSIVDAGPIQNLALWKRLRNTEGTRVYVDEKGVAMDRVLTSVEFEDVVAALTFGGLRAVADRIKRLAEMTKESAPDEPEIVLASLRELALFLLSQYQLVEPEITLDPNGLMNAEWASGQGDIVAMKFLPGGMIRFAAVSAAGTSDPELRAHDELPREEALRAVLAVSPFRSVLAKPRATS